MRRHHVVDIDPEDPSQQLDDLGGFHIEPLSVEAQPSAEAAEELDLAFAENVLGESEPEDELPLDADAELGQDTGEPYGARMTHAGDTTLAAPEDHESFGGSWSGESWIDTLHEQATLMGPPPEEEVVIVDPTADDRPAADKGGGRGER